MEANKSQQKAPQIRTLTNAFDGGTLQPSVFFIEQYVSRQNNCNRISPKETGKEHCGT